MADAAPLHRHRGTRAIQRMVEFAPSTGGLALWVRHHDLPDLARADARPPVATDGNTLFYARGFEDHPVEVQAGLVAHEVLHIALRHAQRFVDLQQLLGDVDLELFNICADAIVNSTLDHLHWLKLPAGSVFLDQLLKQALGVEGDVGKALLEWDVERLYRAVDDRRAPDRGARQGEQARGGGGSAGGAAGAQGAAARDANDASPRVRGREDGPDSARVRALGADALSDLLPDPEAQGPPEAEAEAACEWSARILRGHAGDGAHSMLRTLIADVPRTRTPWEQVLRAQLARGLAQRPGISWSRPARSYIANQGRAGAHRRMPWEPGTSATKPVPRLVVIVDVSGSIADALMERFAREIEAITRRLEAALILVIGDDRVRRVETFTPGRSGLRDIAFDGGGGTDFTPLLEEAGRQRPDIVVVLTDLDGPARLRPRWPVLWAVPEAHADAVPPFGRKVVLTTA